tara:strand:- start:1505 stop:1948 length:444 start_codon:yes stop_codon:yes gene_type:complete
MIIDDRLEFCDNVTLTTGTGTSLQGDVVNIESSRDIGMGQPLYLVIQLTAAVTSGGAATVNFRLASDAAAAIATDGTETDHMSTGAIGKADLTLGKRFVLPLAMGNSYEQYVGLLITTATAALTAGAIDAFVTVDPTGWTAQPDAVN